MRERCLQSLAILLAGLFSAERTRERALAERGSALGVSPAELHVVTPEAQPLKH